MELGNKIKAYREKENMSQDELALKVFVSRQTISNWETNKTYPDIKTLSLLSHIFNITLDDFIKGDIKEMKEIIDEEKIKKFHSLGVIYSIELIVLMISAYPLFKFLDIIGIIIWGIWAIITLTTSIFIEKFKKTNNIQTYKEIVAFSEGKQLTYAESQQELGKRIYQKVLLTILSAVIAIVISAVMIFILEIYT